MPFFSIIIPTYNRANVILSALDSVRRQEYTNWECIIVDDGSTDNTTETVKTICEQDKRIKYIYQQNAERSAARNKGISIATGKYVCFLDSDDSYMPTHLLELQSAIAKQGNPKALFFTNYSNIHNGVKTNVFIPTLKNNPISYFFENAVIPARACISIDILASEKFDEDIIIVEDTILWTRIALKYPVFHIEKNTVLYLLHDDNSISIKNTAFQKRLAGLKIFFKRYPDVAKNLNKILIKKLFGDAYFGIAKHHIYKKNKWDAVINLLMTIMYLKVHNQLKHKILLIYKVILNKEIREYQHP